MQLPDSDAAHPERVRVGGYVARRLRRAKRLTLAADVDTATALVLQRGREWEDAGRPVQEARADRDGADDDLDDVAKDGRAKLAGRSADAMRNAPYTQIFPEGIDYYTAAPLDQEVARYGQLVSRLNEFLDPTDDVRKTAVPALNAGIAAFQLATDAVNTALGNEAIAATRLTSAEEAWDVLLTKVYGTLLADEGKAAAERYFPKNRRNKKKSGG